MTLRVGRPVPRALADAPVLGPAGEASPLGERWAQGTAVLVFLRHFACIACSEHVTMLMPRTHELHALGVRIVFVGNGAAHFIDGFVERNGIVPELVEVTTDPTLAAFEAAGLHRSAWATYRPRAVANTLRAFVAGNRQTSIEGDGYQQGGVVVVDAQGTVVYAHADAALGDHADTDAVVLAAMRSAAAAAGVV